MRSNAVRISSVPRRASRISVADTLPSRHVDATAVQTSARRWQHLGVGRTTLINQLVLLRYWWGESPESLAAFYRRQKVARPATSR